MASGESVSPKLLPNAKPGLFMGFSGMHNGYRVWDCESRCILIKHGVICDERPIKPSSELVEQALPDNPIYNHIGELAKVKRGNRPSDRYGLVGRRVSKEFGDGKTYRGHVKDVEWGPYSLFFVFRVMSSARPIP